MKKSKKVGILTFQNAHNYGAVLQMYGLYKKCKELGYETEIIDYNNEFFVDYYIYKYSLFKKNQYSQKSETYKMFFLHPFRFIDGKIRIKKFNDFFYKNFQCSKKSNKEELINLNNEYDTFIVGSDQVWNMKLSEFDSTYYLNFVNDNKKKISYAASIGKEYITGYEYERMKKYLINLDYCSVRERKAKEILEKQIGIESNVVLDPTMLHDKKFWEELANTSKLKKKKDYILIYTVQEQSNLLEFAKKIAIEENLEVITIFDNQIDYKHKVVRNASIEDFLYYIKNAKYTFVTSFHGFVFSVLFNVDFYFELAKKIPNNNSRLIDLCNTLKLSEREITDNMTRKKDINWNEVNRLLEIERNSSLDFLKNALEGEKNE